MIDLTEKDELLDRLAQVESELDTARALNKLDEVVKLSEVANRLAEKVAQLNQN